jgi:hypothetical protein
MMEIANNSRLSAIELVAIAVACYSPLLTFPLIGVEKRGDRLE